MEGKLPPKLLRLTQALHVLGLFAPEQSPSQQSFEDRFGGLGLVILLSQPAPLQKTPGLKNKPKHFIGNQAAQLVLGALRETLTCGAPLAAVP